MFVGLETSSDLLHCVGPEICSRIGQSDSHRDRHANHNISLPSVEKDTSKLHQIDRICLECRQRPLVSLISLVTPMSLRDVSSRPRL